MKRPNTFLYFLPSSIKYLCWLASCSLLFQTSSSSPDQTCSEHTQYSDKSNLNKVDRANKLGPKSNQSLSEHSCDNVTSWTPFLSRSCEESVIWIPVTKDCFVILQSTYYTILFITTQQLNIDGRLHNREN